MRRSDTMFYDHLGMIPDEYESIEVGQLDPKDYPEAVDQIMREYLAEVRKRLIATTNEEEWDTLDKLDFLTYAEYLEVLDFEFEDKRDMLRRHIQNDTWRKKGYEPPKQRRVTPYGIKYLGIDDENDLNHYKTFLSPGFENYFNFLTKKGPPFKAFFFETEISLAF